jgi:hypothetical protein
VPFDANAPSRTSGTIVSNYPHIAIYQQNNCLSSPIAAAWDNALMCDQTATVRRIMFTNLADPYIFNHQTMKVLYLYNASDVLDP